MSEPTVRAGLEAVVRLIGHASETVRLELIEEAGYASLRFQVDDEPRDAAHSLEYLAAVAQRTAVHFGDRAFPQFHRSVAIGNDWGFSNPDNLYMGATISNEYDYVVRGHVATKVNHTIDGVLRFVLSDEDPGVRNWVDTTGRDRGFANIRVKRDEEPGQMVGV